LVKANLLAGFVAILVAPGAQAASLPEYKVGDVVKDDIVAPVQLVVSNSDETDAQMQSAASKVAVICRYYTNALDQAEGEFRAAFADTRRIFLERLDETFQKRQLDEAAMSTPSFFQFYSSFQHQNEFMPISTNLARAWAKGESDRAIQDSLLATLHEAMLHFIRPPNIAPEVKFGNNVRMVPLSSWDEPLTLEKSDRRGFLVSKNDVVTFTRLRDNLQQAAPADERPTLNYLVTLIKTNCVPDVEVTLQARARRSDAVFVSERYEPGQIIARRGQVIDRRLKAALDQLRQQTPAVAPSVPQPPEKAQSTPAKGETQQSLTQQTPQPQQTQQSHQWTQWVIGGLCGFGLALLAVVWMFARRGQPGSMLAVTRSGNGGLVRDSEAVLVPDKFGGDLRRGVAPHLARLLMDKLVRGLLLQRTSLIEGQQQAAAEMAALESRLEKVNAPLQERLRAYEERILELEKELAQKGQENRELIRFKIQLVRTQLASTKGRLELN
jgi:hypothetical protein